MIVEGDYWRDGAVCVRGALDAGLVDLARRAVEANLADLGPFAKRASAEGDGAFVEDFCSWQRIAELRALALEPRIAEVAAAVMETTGPVRLYHDHLLVKEPGTRQCTPWHQDLPYYNVEGRLNVSLWIPVDPVPRGATLELVAGSHLGPWYMPRTFLDGQAKWFPEGTLEELPDVESDPDRHRVLAWELEPGDLVAFHMLTLHGAGGVDGSDRRRVVSLRYLGEDMRHAVRGWDTSPPFPGLADELPDGAPLDHELFPVVRA